MLIMGASNHNKNNYLLKTTSVIHKQIELTKQKNKQF